MDKVYAEIAACLRASSTVQQHVRDHLSDFVAIKPRRRHGWHFSYPGGRQGALLASLVSVALCR